MVNYITSPKLRIILNTYGAKRCSKVKDIRRSLQEHLWLFANCAQLAVTRFAQIVQIKTAHLEDVFDIN